MSGIRLQWLAHNRFEGVDGEGHAVVISTEAPRDESGFKPTDLLLLALAGCTSVDVVGILQKKRQGLSSLEVDLRGEQEADPPCAFRWIGMHFRLQGTALTPEGVRQAVELAEGKYCSVAASLRPGVEIRTTFEIVASGG
jgi:putative redox protein